MKQKINVNCRTFECEKELDEQRALFLDCFPETAGMPITTKPHYYWKFHGKPTSLPRPSYEYIALKDNKEMVGYYACIPYHYKVDGKEYDAGMVCDVMTSSKYRGAGIFTKLGFHATNEFAKEGLAFSTGYPIRKAPLPGHLKVGWKIMFDMPLYMRFLSADALLKARGYGWAGFLMTPLVKLYNLCCWKPNNKEVEIRVYNHIEQVDGYESFEVKWREGIKIALHKNMEFMKWRLSAPGKEYKFLCAYKKGELVGMTIAVAILKEGVPSYGLVDFMVLPEHLDCLNTIHNALKQMANENGKEAIMTMMSPLSQKKYKMIANGFLRSPFIFHYIIKKFNQEIPDELLKDVSNWELRFIDSDDL